MSSTPEEHPTHSEVTSIQETRELVLNIIRTETALRYPVHNLSSGDPINIEVRKTDAAGATSLVWEVTYNNKYGQPGRLAYKLDTIVINRRIDEERGKGLPVPKAVRLGSLREIAVEAGTGEGNTNAVKRALLQNAFAGLTVKGLHYKTSDRSERIFEFSDTRYGVVFTGETLPDGRKADAVYVIFHDLYLGLLNSAVRRPLDYDYLKALSPTEQRFYEILSYQMVSAVKYKQRAKLRYSEYCQLSTTVRHFELRRARDQMRIIHRPHIASGYIAKDPEFQPTTDEEGRADWFILYVPGKKAVADQRAFDHVGATQQRKKELARRDADWQTLDSSPANLTTVATSLAEAGLGEGNQRTEQPSGTETAAVDEADQVARHFYQLWNKSGQYALLTAGDRGLAQELLRSYPLDESKAIVELCVAHARTAFPTLNTFAGARSMLGIAIGALQERKQEQERATQRLRARAQEDAREAHRARFRLAYEIYVAEQGERLREANPALYAQYEEHRSRERAKALGDFFKPDSKTGRKLLEGFDSPECEAERLSAFFDDVVLDFWKWDAERNPDGSFV